MRLLKLLLPVLFSFITLSVHAKFNNIDIINYNINLDISNLKSKSTKGFTTLTLNTLNETNTVNLYLQGLKIDSIFYKSKKINSFTHNDTIISINLNNKITKLDTVKLSIYYQGKPQKDPSGWGGFYFSDDDKYAFNLGVGMDDNPHNYGRVWFPCNDNFTDKATYNYSVKTQNGHTAICNGDLISKVPNKDSTTTFNYQLNKVIPTYLASVAVGKYDLISDTYYGIEDTFPINIYVNPSLKEKAKESFKNLKSIIRIYEDLFGAYQWNSIGYVTVPFNNGAMEHATSIFLGERFIDGTLNYETLIAHELAHSWFGNLVTCKNANDMWLNEGWASYCEALYIEKLYGKDVYNKYSARTHYKALKECPIYDEGFISLGNIEHKNIYASTIYDKGSDIVHTLRNYVGDSLFFSAIKSYLKDYKHKNISVQEFEKYFSDKTKIDLSNFFKYWIFNPGFPHFSIVDYKYFEKGDSNIAYVKIQQKLLESPEFYNNNKIPLTFIGANNKESNVSLHFDGEYGDSTFTIPFLPVMTILDKDNQVSDASITTNAELNNKQNDVLLYIVGFKYKLLDSLKQNNLNLRVEHNLVNPNFNEKYIFTNGYWDLFSSSEVNSDIEISFNYNPEKSRKTTSKNKNIKLFFRTSPLDEWELIDSQIKGNYISTTKFSSGQYTIGIKK